MDLFFLLGFAASRIVPQKPHDLPKAPRRLCHLRTPCLQAKAPHDRHIPQARPVIGSREDSANNQNKGVVSDIENSLEEPPCRQTCGEMGRSPIGLFVVLLPGQATATDVCVTFPASDT